MSFKECMIIGVSKQNRRISGFKMLDFMTFQHRLVDYKAVLKAYSEGKIHIINASMLGKQSMSVQDVDELPIIDGNSILGDRRLIYIKDDENGMHIVTDVSDKLYLLNDEKVEEWRKNYLWYTPSLKRLDLVMNSCLNPTNVFIKENNKKLGDLSPNNIF